MMETTHQAVTQDGINIPLALVSQYGLKQGASIRLIFEPDSIRIIPVQVDKTTIEKHALRYLLSNVGDAATIEIQSASNGEWLVNVFGRGYPDPIGKLVYAPSGNLLPERSDTAKEMRRAALEASLIL